MNWRVFVMAQCQGETWRGRCKRRVGVYVDMPAYCWQHSPTQQEEE